MSETPPEFEVVLLGQDRYRDRRDTKHIIHLMMADDGLASQLLNLLAADSLGAAMDANSILTAIDNEEEK